MRNLNKIGIIGGGQMGCGIAQVASQAGFTVYLTDQSFDLAENSRKKVAAQLTKLREKGKISESDEKNAQNQIHALQNLDGMKEVDCVIEAVTENPEVKFKLFRQLDQICSENTLLLSNTSSISITAIAAQTKRPSKVAGVHFMNPVPMMKLIEGIRGLQTSDETFQAVRQMSEKLGKVFIEAQDQPGFVVNRILIPMVNEAITALHEGVASIEDIDNAMKLGTNQPMGPLALADFIGLDTCLAIMNVLHQGLGDSKYRPSPLLRNYVAAGWLGKKTGRGFYQYDS